VSRKADFTEPYFQSILEDEAGPKKPKRVILCSGKVYYDLNTYRKEQDIEDTSIIRIEQFYPFNRDRLASIMKQFGKVEKLVWCQEEPENMGAWTFLAPRIRDAVGMEPVYAGRDEAASPAVGSLKIHQKEQAQLVEAAYTL